jgi:hypothetical protein
LYELCGHNQKAPQKQRGGAARLHRFLIDAFLSPSARPRKAIKIEQNIKKSCPKEAFFCFAMEKSMLKYSR